MNILFLTTHANTGGITSYLLTLGEALVKSNHKVWVVSSGGDCEARMADLGIKHETLIIRTKSEVHPLIWLSLGNLHDLVKREKIDIIHAQTRVTQVLGTALSRISSVKLITTCHGFFRPRWFRRTFPCWGEAVIAISKPVAKHLKDDFKVPAEKIHLIANGIDLNRFAPADAKQRQAVRQEWGVGERPVIGIIARLSDVKGIDVLIKSMPMVLEKIPQAQLMIVGQGPEESYLKSLVQEMVLVDQVHFKNVINQPDKLLAGFDIFVMPSLMEGLGLSVMEAQACGIPVVASRVGGLIDLIEDNKTGFLVEPKDIQALANRIIEALQNPAKSKAVAQAARHYIEQNFSSPKMMRETLKVYEQYSRR